MRSFFADLAILHSENSPVQYNVHEKIVKHLAIFINSKYVLY